MKKDIFLPAILFTLVALMSFSAWAFGGKLFSSEIGLYSACAVVFLSLGGISLLPGSPLSSTNSKVGFCIRFAIGFIVYSIVWSVSWFTFRSTFGEVIGSFLGILGLLAILRTSREIKSPLIVGTAIIFLWHTLGYYTGELFYESLQGRGALAVPRDSISPITPTIARMSWGLFYGLGMGLGLSHVIQRSSQIRANPSTQI